MSEANTTSAGVSATADAVADAAQYKSAGVAAAAVPVPTGNDELAASPSEFVLSSIAAMNGQELADRLGLSEWAVPPSAEGYPKDVVGFSDEIAKAAVGWTGVFKDIPASHEKRKEALGGAMKIKMAVKKIAAAATAKPVPALPAALGPVPPVPVAAAVDGAGEGSAAETGSNSNAESSGGSAASSAVSSSSSGGDDSSSGNAALVACQAQLKELVLGVLELTFPADSTLAKANFPDPDAVAESMDRLDEAAAATASLSNLFTKAGKDPAKTAEAPQPGMDTLPPELMKMLEQAMAKQKGKGGKKGKGATAKEKSKQAWLAAEGKMSALLSEQIWESLCWQRGSFQHIYLSSRFNALEQDDPAGATSVASGASDAPLPRNLFDRAVKNLHHMLRAQGPLAGDADDIQDWTLRMVKDDDETSALFNHGVYSSTHLLALKYQAELVFWRWKYFPSAEDRELYKAYAIRTLKRFVHVVNDIMPGRQWTCEVEKKRLEEISGIVTPAEEVEMEEEAVEEPKIVEEHEAGSGDAGDAEKGGGSGGGGHGDGAGEAADARSGSPKGGGGKKKKKNGKKKK